MWRRSVKRGAVLLAAATVPVLLHLHNLHHLSEGGVLTFLQQHKDQHLPVALNHREAGWRRADPDTLSLQRESQKNKTYHRLHTLLTTLDKERRCSSILPLGGYCWCFTRFTKEQSISYGQADGAKVICLDLLPATSCTVLSFGINYDFTFDLAMADLGCEVHAFDPTMNTASGPVAERLYFHAVGVGARDGQVGGFPVLSLASVLELVGWQDRPVLDYVKMDVEGSEWEVLEHELGLPGGGVLGRVRQLEVEFHLRSMHPALADGQPNLREVHMANHTLRKIENADQGLRVMEGLVNAGFRLIHQVGYIGCKQISEEKCLPFLMENLWINTNLANIYKTV